jgi:hypothetical protein
VLADSPDYDVGSLLAGEFIGRERLSGNRG